jgi:hypothetical protein
MTPKECKQFIHIPEAHFGFPFLKKKSLMDEDFSVRSFFFWVLIAM